MAAERRRRLAREPERADLTDADLTDANLTDAVLTGADLTRADLTRAKRDFFLVLYTAPKEVAGLREALVEGRVNGSTYEGECACLVGTIANVRGVEYSTIAGLEPDANRPAERLFLAVKKGDTPENHPVVKIVVEWIDEWMELQGVKA